MSTLEPLPVRLARSLTTSALAVCAAVLAHLLVDEHAPAATTVLAVGAVVTVADLLVAPFARRPWTLVVRLLGLQVAVHVAVSTAAIAGGRSTASGTTHHGLPAVAPGTATTVGWDDLLPSAPMLLAHVAVAALVGGALQTVGRTTDLPRQVRLAAARVRRLAVPGSGVLALLLAAPERLLHRPQRAAAAAAAVPTGPRHLVAARTVVRRGPPALLPA